MVSFYTKENLSCFKNEKIRKALEVIFQVAKKRHLGIKRWDDVIDTYFESGVVVIPIKVNNVVFDEPFYFVCEKVNEQEMLYIKPLKGEPYRIGDTFGWFGISRIKEYSGQPLFLVEGISDWNIVRKYYPWVLSTLTSSISSKQLYYLYYLTEKVILGFDADEVGSNADKTSKLKLEKIGIKYSIMKPSLKDWAAMWEDDYNRISLESMLSPLNKNV